MEIRSFGKLYNKLRQNNIPFVAQWELTTKCNLDCLHCCIKNEQLNNELTFHEIKDILVQLKAENCMVQRFSGGEPFLRKDIFKILELATKMGFAVNLLSNGTLLNKDDVKRLKMLGIRNIQISLYGATARTHESITQVRGSFNKTMNTIKLLKKYRIPFNIAVMSFNKNFDELRQLKKMGKKEKWQMMFDFVIFPSILNSKNPVVLRVTDRQLELATRYGLLTWYTGKNKKRTKRQFRFEERFRGSLGVHIGSSGKVSPAVLLRMEAGDLRKDSFSNIWHNSEVFKYLRNIDEKEFECFYCKYYNKCCRRPELAYLEHGSVTSKPKEICRINNIFHRFNTR